MQHSGRGCRPEGNFPGCLRLVQVRQWEEMRGESTVLAWAMPINFYVVWWRDAAVFLFEWFRGCSSSGLAARARVSAIMDSTTIELALSLATLPRLSPAFRWRVRAAVRACLPCGSAWYGRIRQSGGLRLGRVLSPES